MPINFKNQTITTNKEYKMKKALLALLSATLLFTVITPAQAEDQKVLAIIDTAINSTKFSSIIQEVCYTTVKSATPSQDMSCPNGQLFMEGPGAASAPWPTTGTTFLNNDTYHGDAMVKAALAIDPTIKIVFVRFVDVAKNGNSRGDIKALSLAIDWVSKNASKYGIDALSISQSSIDANNLLQCTSNSTVINAIASLNKNNIPTFAATGNDKSKTVVGFPACVSGVVGVGGLTGQVYQGAQVSELATNSGPGIDIVARGDVNITKYNGSPYTLAGSSGSTAVASATYLGKNSPKNSEQYLKSLPLISVTFPYKDAKNVLLYSPVVSMPDGSK